MNQHTADTKAANTFQNATMDDVKTAWVSTFVQVGRFTAREARDVRRWATMASVEKVGHHATAQWQAEMVS